MSDTIVDTLRKTRKEEGVALLHNPAYREQYKGRFDEARKKGVDVVLCDDGTMILIELKPVMIFYVWDPRKREFVRKKQQAIAKSDSCSS